MPYPRKLSAGDALLERLLVGGGDPAVKALVPALLAGKTPNRFLCMRLLKRGPLLYPVVAPLVANLTRGELIEILQTEPFLPEVVLLDIIAKHGKSATVMVAVCKRSDLTDNVGRALAKRRTKSVVRALVTNQFAPAVARWKVSVLVDRLGLRQRDYDGNGFARAYLLTQALTNLGEMMCGAARADRSSPARVSNPAPKGKTSSIELLSEVFRLLPVDHVDTDIAAGLFASDLIDARLLKSWAWRKPTGDAARLLLRLAARLPDDPNLIECCDHLTVAGSYFDTHRQWADDTSVDAAWDAKGLWRLAALCSPALDKSRLHNTVTSSFSQLELAAAAVNVAVDAHQAAVLYNKLDPDRRALLCAAPLDDATRAEMLTGHGAPQVAKMMARTLNRAVTPDWFVQWWTKPLAIAALTAAGDAVEVASPLAEKMVAAWPDTLEFALSHVTVRHELGPVVLAELASRLGRLDDTAAAVVATMLHSWTGALSDLVTTAELI